MIATVPDLAVRGVLPDCPRHKEHQLSRGVRVFCQQRNVSRAGMNNGSKGQYGKGRVCPAKPEMRA